MINKKQKIIIMAVMTLLVFVSVMPVYEHLKTVDDTLIDLSGTVCITLSLLFVPVLFILTERES